MKTIVLDDDPTGTQSASNVRVLLVSDATLLAEALRDADSVYVQTNTRAIDEASAVELVRQVRDDALAAGRELGEDIQFVLRGDSTLRGHVFAETEQFLDDDALMIFVPAFPDGGRTTRGGVHYVATDGVDVPAHETEYADDPVFPFANGALAAYVSEKSSRAPLPITLDVVRGDPGTLAAVLRTAPARAVAVPDAVTNDDIRLIADAIRTARADGRSIVVRSAAPLAAMLAGVESSGLLERPLVDGRPTVLLACGSHTGGASAQLERVTSTWGESVVLDTSVALDDPEAAGHDAASRASGLDGPVLVVTTSRERSAEHNTLDHGERVMRALTTAVRDLLPSVDVVVAKGGITSAEVARVGVGATSAVVVGQVLPGVSVWRMTAVDGREILYVVVPGNVGGPDTLVEVLAALGHAA
ncbi:MAG: four-carbon acid sugar kinase family protein [Mycetocola sp.]